MDGLSATLERLDPISLEEMDEVRLMDRVDTKFTFRNEQLPQVLKAVLDRYRILEIKGQRASHYQTLYFDTDQLALYLQHHRGKLARYKIRCRKYVESDTCFFEIKTKTNKGRTQKQRISCNKIVSEIAGESEELLKKETNLSAGELKPRLWVNFTRLTFVSKSARERLTIDLNLSYQNERMRRSFPKLVIAEVKQDRASSASHFVRQMNHERIWNGSMSKYCFGIVNLYPHVKMNLFKEKIRQLQQLAT